MARHSSQITRILAYIPSRVYPICEQKKGVAIIHDGGQISGYWGNGGNRTHASKSTGDEISQGEPK
jgi:hypothetical protein